MYSNTILQLAAEDIYIILTILVAIIENIAFLPILGPVAHPENFHFTVCCRADHTVKAGIYDHFLANKTGECIYCFIFSENTAVDVYVAS
jgi:hypothetical protein